MILGILFTSGSFYYNEVLCLQYLILQNLTQQSLVPKNQSKLYQFLHCIDSNPMEAALCWADEPNTLPPSVVLAPILLLSVGTWDPPPAVAGGEHSL